MASLEPSVSKVENGPAASSNSMETPQVEPSILHLRSRLIFHSNSPFYCVLGYMVIQTSIYSAQLLSIGSIGEEYLGKDAHLTSISEIGGVPLRVPISALIDIGDMLYLLSVCQTLGNLPLLTSFLYQDCSMYRLHVAIAIAYVDNQLTYLSEPNALYEEPVKEMMTINLLNGHLYHYRVMFFRERCFQEVWRPTRLQLTSVSPVVPLTALEFVSDKGVFCRGPIDPWNQVNRPVTPLSYAFYWIPCSVYNCASSSACKVLHALVTTCPPWAFSTLKYNVRFLVCQLTEPIPTVS